MQPDPEIPKAYQGEEVKSPKELSIGQTIIDSHYGWPRIVRVVKRHRYSATVEYQGRTYGVPIYHLSIPAL